MYRLKKMPASRGVWMKAATVKSCIAPIREVTSTSNCTTFQARRLNIRYRDEDGKPQIAATLNGTLATTRWLIPILENHQQPDGSVRVPKALQPFLGGRDVLEPVR